MCDPLLFPLAPTCKNRRFTYNCPLSFSQPVRLATLAAGRAYFVLHDDAPWHSGSRYGIMYIPHFNMESWMTAFRKVLSTALSLISKSITFLGNALAALAAKVAPTAKA